MKISRAFDKFCGNALFDHRITSQDDLEVNELAKSIV